MPELPEVETVRRNLKPHVEGRRIEEVRFYWERTCLGDADLTAERLAGQRVDRLDRYGKFLVFRLRRAGIESVLNIHLRMTGNLLLNGSRGPYTRAQMLLDRGMNLTFHDIRKFGKWEWSRELPPRIRKLGPEPLEISLADFRRRLSLRRGAMKPLLLNQVFLRGLGNIYADEALFRARIHPLRSAAKVGPRKARDLHRAIQSVLCESIAAGGTTISNFVDGSGSQGYFQLQTQVYGKAGKPCEVCSTPIRRIVVGQRGTHFCPRCQIR